MEHTAIELIDKLIDRWRFWETNEEYYLTVLAPDIVRSDGSLQLDSDEKDIVTKLRRLLSEEEWQKLPILIAQRHANKLKELASDRERAKALREAKLREDEELARLKEEEEAQIIRKRLLINRIKGAFDSDFLSADRVLAVDPDIKLFTDDEYEQVKIDFVRDWAARELKQPLDSEQAAAVAATGGDIQVVARAGSGKTRTLVTRAIFLQRHCRVSPSELLLLAFNKRAAEGMKGRLTQALGEELPHVMTFHALAYALVHPEEELVYDDVPTDQLGLSREVQEVIDEHIRSTEYGDLIRNLMLSHFREDWECIVDGRFHMTMDEFLEHRRSLPRESLNGDYVKSFGEKVIANALFEYGVDYRYERNFRWNGVNYRPDFTIKSGTKGGVIIEYFGLAGDADYDEMSQHKRQFWTERNEWTFLELSPADLAINGVDGFIRLLMQMLEKAGVASKRRSEEEIWELVRTRALDRFTTAMRTFIGRCRKLNLNADNLKKIVVGHTSCMKAEAIFLDVGVSVYRGYLESLAAGEKEDFDGLMWRSVSLVRNGQTRFARDKGREQGDVAKLSFIMIDEFQDFSQMFFDLLDGIRSVNSQAQFFCVGDNWQSINAFAGSNPVFFENFDHYFRSTSRCYIRTNYRSASSVVETGNAVMRGRGEEAKSKRNDSGSVWVCKLDEFSPSASEQARHNGDEITPAVLRLTRHFLDDGVDIVMLSRRNGLPWYVNYDRATSGTGDSLIRFQQHIRSFLPEEDRRRIGVSTTHSYKGLEKSVVIVLDAVDRSYPLMHPNWVFLRIFGDQIDRIEDEERRLFYVAITRAKEALSIITESMSESQYLVDIRRQEHLDVLQWDQLTPVASLDGGRIEIRVFEAYDVRDKLKDLSYRWNQPGKYWYKAVLAEGFSFDALIAQPWAKGAVKVEAYSEAGELLHKQ